jgi:hypothetical protein
MTVGVSGRARGLVAVAAAVAVASAIAARSPVGAARRDAPVQGREVSFCVVPPGPITDRARVELRVGLRNPGSEPRTYRVTLHADRRAGASRLADRTVTLPPGGSELVTAWWPARGNAGAHRMLYRVEGGGKRTEGSWPIEVVASPTRALPYFQGTWIDGYGPNDPDTMTPALVERELRASVDAMDRLGMRVLIYTFTEWYGRFYYPSRLEFFDRDIKAISRGSSCTVDAVGAILSQADKHGQHVILGLGRNGDLHLLWEFDKPDWPERNRAAIKVATSVAQELLDRYGRHRSFYGWYLTHEMNDLARSSAYYDEVAAFCKRIAPEKPVLIAPAGTPIWKRETIAASKVDIIAPQDAVGSGYMPYVNTWDPYKRIAELPAIYAGYADVHAGTGKHLWTDLEIWEMDGKHGYSRSYPPKFARVRDQIRAQVEHVDMLTAYAYLGFLQHPGSARPNVDARSVELYEDYVAYLKALPRALRPPAFR